MQIPESEYRRVIVIGGGFAGLEVVKTLVDQPVQVVLLDRQNFFSFQPLLYQVATGGLEPNSVAYPLRRLFRRAENVLFRVADVQHIDTEAQTLHTSTGQLTYDYLVVATGSRPQFFDLDQQFLLPLKTVPDALRLRNWVLQRFERALVEKDARKQAAFFNFVVVGGGPTGVELAGALAEMKRYVLPKDYASLDFDRMQIYLLEGLDRVLPAMSEKASRKALENLDRMGVQVGLNKLISEYDGQQIEFGKTVIPTRNLIWTAGVEAAPPGGLRGDAFSIDRRLVVDTFSRLRGVENVFAVGDVALMPTSEYPDGHPMLAPVAIQQGRQLGKNLLNNIRGQALKPFRYNNKGTMATIGRNKAVADLPLGTMSGFPAWIAWMLIHLLWLVGFRNKAVVLVNWIYNYFTYEKALRLIITKPREKEMPVYQDEAVS